MTTENPTPGAAGEDPLRNLAGQVDQYRRQAENLRQLLSGRALLECPSCGLHEDVRADMTLVVIAADAPDRDTGLSFSPMDDAGAYWWCPGCGQPFAVDRGVE